MTTINNTKDRLSVSKRLGVGPNDARRRIQKAGIKPLMKVQFDARDKLNRNPNITDAREKLNKLKQRSIGKVPQSRPLQRLQPSKSIGKVEQLKTSNVKLSKPVRNIPQTNSILHVKQRTSNGSVPRSNSKMKSLMPNSVKSNSKTSLKDGALVRTVKSASKVQTNLNRGTLTRTLKGTTQKTLQRHKIPIQSQLSKKRESDSKYVWSQSSLARRSLPTRFVDTGYDEYSPVIPRQIRPVQEKPLAWAIQPAEMSRHYEQDQMSVFSQHYISPSLVDRSYRPDLALMQQDETRSFREVLQQQELERMREARLREEMALLEQRRRSNMMHIQASEERYLQEKEFSSHNKTKSNVSSYGYDVIVSNLLPLIHESEIENGFEQFGKVLNIEFINKTTAKVKYESEDDANVAAKYLNNKEIPVVFGTLYLNTKYSKQRISVKMVTNTSNSDFDGISYRTNDNVTSRIFGPSIRKSERSVPPLMRSRSAINRFTSNKSQPRRVEPDISATHSALFSSRNVQMGPPQKRFLVRRM